MVSHDTFLFLRLPFECDPNGKSSFSTRHRNEQSIQMKLNGHFEDGCEPRNPTYVSLRVELSLIAFNYTFSITYNHPVCDPSHNCTYRPRHRQENRSIFVFNGFYIYIFIYIIYYILYIIYYILYIYTISYIYTLISPKIIKKLIWNQNSHFGFFSFNRP